MPASRKRSAPSVTSIAFGVPVTFTSESGRVYLISKWSIRKMAVMAGALTDVGKMVMSAIQPTEDQKLDIGQVLEILPAVIPQALQQVAFVISETLTRSADTSADQVTPDDVLDNMTFDDLGEILNVIIDQNFSEKTRKKWKRLLTGGLTKMGKATA